MKISGWGMCYHSRNPAVVEPHYGYEANIYKDTKGRPTAPAFSLLQSQRQGPCRCPSGSSSLPPKHWGHPSQNGITPRAQKAARGKWQSCYPPPGLLIRLVIGCLPPPQNWGEPVPHCCGPTLTQLLGHPLFLHSRPIHAGSAAAGPARLSLVNGGEPQRAHQGHLWHQPSLGTAWSRLPDRPTSAAWGGRQRRAPPAEEWGDSAQRHRS